jgi:hypothetical protein
VVQKEAEVPGGPETEDIPEVSDATKTSEAPVADTLKNVAAPMVEAAKSVAPAAMTSQSDAPAEEEPSLLTKIAEALPSLTTQEESVKTAPGSSEAPGAFPELDAKGEAELETKTSQPQESGASPLTKTESLSSTKAAEQPSTHSQGATEEAPTAMRESIADA